MSSAGPSRPEDHKAYRCTTCERRFARLEHLQRHTRTHTKDKPFSCFCGRSFARNDLLKRHKLRTHPSIEAPLEPAAPIASQAAENPDDHVENVANFSVTPRDDPAHLFDSQVSPSSFRGEPSSSLDPIHDFAAFMESIGLTPDWNAFDFFDIGPGLQQTEPSSQPDEQLRANSSHFQSTLTQRTSRPDANLRHKLGSVPTTVEVNAFAAISGSEQSATAVQWSITEKQWHSLADKVMASRDLLHTFTLPSRHAMSRYFQSYADQFHRHYPMIHPTYCPESSPLCLTLAIAAVGARYRLESKNGLPLYEAAMTLTLEQRRPDSLHESHETPDGHRTHMIQTLVLLMGYGAWDSNIELLGGALDLQSVLSGYIRSSLRDKMPAEESNLQWKSWIHAETRRRTILVSYAYLVIQSLAYDLPPVVLSSEIQLLQLPCESPLWEARSEEEWNHSFHQLSHNPVLVVDALRYLLGSTAGSQDTMVRLSPIGSFIMLQALIQRIFLARQLHSTSAGALPELDTLQKALARWKAISQQSPNSSLDPRSIEEPIPFTSAAFLSLAFARLHIDLGPCRQLHTRDPKLVALGLLKTPVPDCSPEAVPALLHAAHALSVPVLLGVDYVSRNQTLFWTCEQALCGLESAIFLWRWLQSAGDSFTWHNLNVDEKGIISWVLFSVSETLQSIDASVFGLEHEADVSELSFPNLGILVLKIWARIFSSQTAWPLTQEIGMSLKLLAEEVEAA